MSGVLFFRARIFREMILRVLEVSPKVAGVLGHLSASPLWRLTLDIG